MYEVGQVFYYLLFGEYPHSTREGNDISRMSLSKGFNTCYPELEYTVFRFIRKCLSNSRPTVKEALAQLLPIYFLINLWYAQDSFAL
jgi:hypothetical protein